MKCSRMPMQTVTVVSGIGRYNEKCLHRLSPILFPVGPSSRQWSSRSLWAGWACQGAGPGPRQWHAPRPAPPPAPSQCRGWPGWRPQVTPWSLHIICIYFSLPGPGGVALGGPLQTSWEQMGVAQPAAQWLGAGAGRVFCVFSEPPSASLCTDHWSGDTG